MTDREIHVVVVTGLSGSGKSTVIHAFEDIGYFCIDNLPVPLMPGFLTLCERDMPDVRRVALGIDIRGRKFLDEYDPFFRHLEEAGHRLEIIFLEAETDILQRRFSQTRRMHPLGASGAHLVEAITREREQLGPLRRRATRIVDTSAFSVHQLKDLLVRSYSWVSDRERLSVQVLSFGFKYGLPFEADLVMDVRFLPNPHFVEDLRAHDGCSTPVRDWVMKWEAARNFVSDYSRLLLSILPAYMAEGRRYLTLAVGCTGGRHRSVVIASEVAAALREHGYYTVVFHRDIHLE